MTLFLLRMKKIQNEVVLHYIVKITFLIILLRFSAVIFVYSSELLYITVLQPQYNESKELVQKTKDELQELQNRSDALPLSKHQKSSWERFSLNLETLRETFNISQQLSDLQESIDRASENIITLITIFIIETLLMPLLFMWLIVLAIKLVFRVEFNRVKIKLLYN